MFKYYNSYTRVYNTCMQMIIILRVYTFKLPVPRSSVFYTLEQYDERSSRRSHDVLSLFPSPRGRRFAERHHESFDVSAPSPAHRINRERDLRQYKRLATLRYNAIMVSSSSSLLSCYPGQPFSIRWRVRACRLVYCIIIVCATSHVTSLRRAFERSTQVYDNMYFV